jgi:hypothetical protein
LIHHTFELADGGAAVTSAGFTMGGLIVAASNTVNPCAPSAMKLRRIGVMSGCLVVNSAGNWTLRLRVNESGSDSATFTFGLAALPGSKDFGAWSSEVLLQAGDTYHLVADGPSRNFVVVRPILEWEVL